MKDDKQRPTATELLQHKWIKAAKSLRVTQKLVTEALPKLEQQRDAQRKMDEMEDDENKHRNYNIIFILVKSYDMGSIPI